MKTPGYRVKILIVGCGAIGSGMAEVIQTELKKDCRITGLYDIQLDKAESLAKRLKLKNVTNTSLDKLIKSCDCMVEAVNAPQTKSIIRKALEAKRSVLAMSVGKLLNAPELFRLARKNKNYILLPSGAVAGLDAIKAASLKKIKKITLTTRKSPKSLGNNPYFEKKGIDLSKIKKETIVFEGNVKTAVKHFPQNINVAATIALASQTIDKLKIRIITSPKFKRNTHEIEIEGDFGRMTSRTENVVCPDNPKTSYLAVLSGLQTLRQYCTGILVGT